MQALPKQKVTATRSVFSEMKYAAGPAGESTRLHYMRTLCAKKESLDKSCKRILASNTMTHCDLWVNTGYVFT
jgi:hypothetical protein